MFCGGCAETLQRLQLEPIHDAPDRRESLPSACSAGSCCESPAMKRKRKAETKSIPSTCLHLSGFGLLGQLMTNDIGRSYLEPSLCRSSVGCLCTTTTVVEGRAFVDCRCRDPVRLLGSRWERMGGGCQPADIGGGTAVTGHMRPSARRALLDMARLSFAAQRFSHSRNCALVVRI